MLTRFALLLSLGICLPAGVAAAVEEFSYRVTDRKPQDRQNFVQGLEIVDGYLYVSSGNYGRSRLLRYRFDEGTLDTGRQVHPRLFAEGLTVFGDRVYQLTWRARMALVYSRDELAGIEWFPIPGEGWGLTNNGEELIYSDGSHRLHFLSPTTRRISRSIEVRQDGVPVPRLNELEWVDGRIWANIWRTDRIVIIDPASGEVTAGIDLSGLLPEAERRPDTDVLNGIARDPADGSIWVTGKRWPWLYQIEPVPRTRAESRDESR